MRRRLIEAGLPQRDGRPDPVPARRSSRRRSGRRRASFQLFDRAGEPRADIGDDRVHFIPGSSGLKILDHRTGEARQAMSLDFAEYIRLGDGLANIPYLATAFSTARHRAAGVRRVAPLPVPDELDEAGRLGRLHRARRAPDGRDDGRCSATAPTTCAPGPMSIFTITATGNFRYSEDSCQNLIDCVEAGIPVEIVPVTLMGLIAPVTLDRGDGLPHDRRPRRDHDGPGDPARRAGPVRRGAGDVPHEDRVVADGRDRGAPARRRLCRGREVARAADPVVHGPVGREDARRPGRRRDVRVGAARGPRRREQRQRPGDARLPARLLAAEARLRRRDVRPGAPFRARGPRARRPAGRTS